MTPVILNPQQRDATVEAHSAPPPGLPYAQLNLRYNPFGEIDLAQWAELAVVEVDDFVRRLAAPGYAVQFMGDKGRGKTTHLMAIRRHFPEAVYVHVGENERPRIGRGQPLLIDEVQRVPPWRRWWLFRRRVSFALGTHECVAAELRRAGLEVETVHVARRLDAGRLCDILNRRLQRARRGPGEIPCVRPETAEQLMDRFGDDVRAIQGEMYSLFQHLREVQHV